jgi:hypothetical protein
LGKYSGLPFNRDREVGVLPFLRGGPVEREFNFFALDVQRAGMPGQPGPCAGFFPLPLTGPPPTTRFSISPLTWLLRQFSIFPSSF